MRSYPLNEARAEFSKLVERALDGEPQRVTRYGKDAVVIVSEAQWVERRIKSPNLADLFLKYAGETGYGDLISDEVLATQDRPLGSDFLDEDF